MNQNAPLRPSKFKRKSVKKISGFPKSQDDEISKEMKDNSSNMESLKLGQLYSPQHKTKRKFSENERFDKDSFSRQDSIGSRKWRLPSKKIDMGQRRHQVCDREPHRSRVSQAHHSERMYDVPSERAEHHFPALRSWRHLF